MPFACARIGYDPCYSHVCNGIRLGSFIDPLVGKFRAPFVRRGAFPLVLTYQTYLVFFTCQFLMAGVESKLDDGKAR